MRWNRKLGSKMHAREGTRVVFHAANIFTLSMGTARERERREGGGRERSKMPVFRKRVRDAFMVISVFSEWPESLGSLPVLCQKHYLASMPRAHTSTAIPAPSPHSSRLVLPYDAFVFARLLPSGELSLSLPPFVARQLIAISR